ncbi:MAG: class I SAM-dependent methyltransferase [Firmicutes bacterium]|nr:class I SAM-dependent methyltransferase [Bacillota bacterium]
MYLKANEKQVIIAIQNLKRKNGGMTHKELEDFGNMFFCSYKLDWEKAIANLLSKQMIELKNNTYSICCNFNKLAETLTRKYPRLRYWYNHWYSLGMKSEAHSRLCQAAYGVDLCQTGMITLKQIEYIIQNYIEEKKTCLDMGCGLGLISEYISGRTLCKISGIDVIASAIRNARKRTINKREYLEFYLSNMTKYFKEEVNNKYDYIFFFDTVYFLADQFSEVIPDAIRALNKNGKILIFYSAWNPKDSGLSAGSTKLADYLNNEGYKYKTVDFTEDERRHWQIKKETLMNLEDSFLTEGNKIIYTNRMMEADFFTNMMMEDKLYRYLYVLEK